MQRHLLRHGDSPRPRPSGRSKHACVTCHASKIKCDGTKPCSACLNKGAGECRYELQGNEASQDGPSLPREVPAVDDAPAAADSSIEIDPSPTPRPAINQRTSPDLDLPGLSDPMPRVAPRGLRADSNGAIDWFSNLIIERDPSSATNREPLAEVSESNFIPIHKDLYPLPKATSQKYLDSYYAHFHHRWTIIHTPSMDMKHHPSLVLSCMKMIGAWISGTQDAKWLAVAMHERLTAHVIPPLVWPGQPSP